MRQFLRDNWEEWLIGFILGLGFFPVLGLGAVVLGVVTGILYRLGGSGWLGTKAWRRVLLPSVIAVFMHLKLLNTLLAIAVSVGILCVGYGQRSTQPPDEGSPFGNLMLRLLGERLGKIVSRATIIVGIWGVWYTALNWR